MKIYGVRDRLVDWFIQPPFFAHSDQAAKSALADLVNSETKHVITQAPQHFELWRLGEINETTGDLTADREFIGDASSYIRPDIRSNAGTQPGEGTAGDPAHRSESPSERTSRPD